MCIRDRYDPPGTAVERFVLINEFLANSVDPEVDFIELYNRCLLYTSDAADERSSVDLGGRRIIKKKNKGVYQSCPQHESNKSKVSHFISIEPRMWVKSTQ